jgi:hypothetical protein
MLLSVSTVGCTEPTSETVIITIGGGGAGGSGGGSGAGGGGAGTSHLKIGGFWATYATKMDGTVVSLRADVSMQVRWLSSIRTLPSASKSKCATGEW